MIMKKNPTKRTNPRNHARGMVFGGVCRCR